MKHSGAGIDTFPFGQPIRDVAQADRSPKRVFVLGVYASAVHAQWIGPDKRTRVRALGVASEPEIFWSGACRDVKRILADIELPAEAGSLVPADARLNGPSGRALDELFLTPLGLTRDDAWLSDLLPRSCRNEKQAAALIRAGYPPEGAEALPPYTWPPVPANFADEARRADLLEEVCQAQPEILITLGDKPLEHFARYHGAHRRLAAYGKSEVAYGQAVPIEIGGLALRLLPLVHPRTAAGLGHADPVWRGIHAHWIAHVAPGIL